MVIFFNFTIRNVYSLTQASFITDQEPESIPKDGRRRLASPRQIRQDLALSDDYDFSPRFGTNRGETKYKVNMPSFK